MSIVPTAKTNPQIQDSTGYVYLVGNRPAMLVKVGYSTCPELRLANMQVGSGIKLKLLAAIKGARKDEKSIHYKMAHLKASGEWFRLDASAVELLSRYFGVDVSDWETVTTSVAPEVVQRPAPTHWRNITPEQKQQLIQWAARGLNSKQIRELALNCEKPFEADYRRIVWARKRTGVAVKGICWKKDKPKVAAELEAARAALRDVAEILAAIHAKDRSCRLWSADTIAVTCVACLAQARINDALPDEWRAPS